MIKEVIALVFVIFSMIIVAILTILEIKEFTLLFSVNKKQIPKKPIIDTNYSGGRYTVGICPNCKKLIGLLHFAKVFKYCSECGQAIDWSDEE